MSDGDRAALTAGWYELTKEILPQMAEAQNWSINQDHCFMRVCLDVSLGQRWDLTIKRPAIRHLTNAQLQNAIAVAEEIIASPAILPRLNAQSLAYRRAR